jgi:hypothetical protein
MKVKLTTNVEYDLKIEAESYGINWADVLENQARMWLAIKKKDVSGINLELARIEFQKEQNAIMKHQMKMLELKSAIEKCESELKEKEEKRLEKEKAHIEALKMCIKCGNEITTKPIRVEKGNMCKSCYSSLTFAEAKQYGV